MSKFHRAIFVLTHLISAIHGVTPGLSTCGCDIGESCDTVTCQDDPDRQCKQDGQVATSWSCVGSLFSKHCTPMGCSAPHSCDGVSGQCKQDPSSKISKGTCETQCVPRPEGAKPVVIVPGIVGSNIQAKLNKPSVVQPLCSKTSDWYYAWLESFEVAPDAVKCLFDNLKLKHLGEGNVTNNDGVTTRIADYGGIGDIRCAMPKTATACNTTVNWGYALDQLQAAGYSPGVNLFGAPYDFRYGPKSWFRKEFPQLKALIEKAYTTNNDTKVVITSISLGGPYFHLFLTHFVDPAWKQKYVDSWVSMSSLWNGATQVAQMLTAGLGWDGISWIKPQVFREGVRNWPAMIFMLPFPYDDVNGTHVDDTYITSSKRSYKASDMQSAVLDAGLPDTAAILKSISQYRTSTSPPGVKTYCWFGKGIKTAKTLSFSGTDLSDFDAMTVQMSDGDGTVEHSSLRICNDWGGDTVVKTWFNVSHTGMLTEPSVVSDLVAIATGSAH